MDNNHHIVNSSYGSGAGSPIDSNSVTPTSNGYSSTAPNMRPGTTAGPDPVIPQKTKTNRGMLIALIITCIIAVAGCAFGVYGIIAANQKPSNNTTQSNTNNTNGNSSSNSNNGSSSQGNTGSNELCEMQCETTAIINEVIDNWTAQNIADPYLKSLVAYGNILDTGLNPDSKIQLAAKNVDPSDVTESSKKPSWYIDLPYYYLNQSYKYLFGSAENLEKRDYTPPKSGGYIYQADTDSFRINHLGSGGTGGAVFSIVKSATYTNDGIDIEIYHSSIPWCDAGVDLQDPNYCIRLESQKGEVTITDGNMSEIIKNYTESIPVYHMIFSRDSGHYVLTSVILP